MTNNVIGAEKFGVKFILGANVKLKKLIAPSSLVNVSLNDIETGLAYQVPSGKKFTIIGFDTFSNSVGDFATTTVVNSATGAVNIISTSNTILTGLVFIEKDIAATLFLTQVTSNFSLASVLWGIEEDA